MSADTVPVALMRTSHDHTNLTEKPTGVIDFVIGVARLVEKLRRQACDKRAARILLILQEFEDFAAISSGDVGGCLQLCDGAGIELQGLEGDLVPRLELRVAGTFAHEIEGGTFW
ncbi:MAG: hypothetical protein ACPGQM_14155 [Alphaproteobacteria bacterium]